MKLGGFEVKMPLDWSILVGDSEGGSDPEILPLTSINERGFEAFVFNPIKGYKLDYTDIEIINIYQDVRWFFPKMKNGQLLSIPLHNEYNPPCAFFVKEISRQSEVVSVGDLM